MHSQIVQKVCSEASVQIHETSNTGNFDWQKDMIHCTQVNLEKSVNH